MIEIVEYNEEYRNRVNRVLYDILVDEYGFYDFKKILKEKNKEYLEEPNRLWVALLEGKEVIGTTGILEIDEKNALLKKVYVKKEHRGSGIAQEMLNICIEYALEKNYENIYLETYHRLERAKGFYRKNGFVEYEGNYEKTQGDEVRFVLDLKCNANLVN